MDKFIKVDGVSYNATLNAKKDLAKFQAEHRHNYPDLDDKAAAKALADVHGKLKEAVAPAEAPKEA